jgi:CRP/FNR family transcriptional regulator, cyclic AMP receptor protein
MRLRVPRQELELLKAVPLFSQCSQAELRSVAQLGTALDVPEGKTLVTEGTAGRQAFLVLGGEADCSVRGRHLARFGPGDFFGETALLTAGGRTATVVAKTPMRVMVLSAGEFRDLLMASPSISVKLLAATAQRLRDADAAMT